MAEFTSPSPIQPHNSTMHCHTLTRFCRSSPKLNRLMTGAKTSRSGRALKSKSMSKCRDMLGLVKPSTRSPPKQAANKVTTTAATPLPIRYGDFRDSADALSTLTSCAGASGRRIPNEETVEATQNTEKQVKPMFNTMPLLRFGGLFKPRIKHVSKMYANISGQAHFEITWTARMHSLAQSTWRGLPCCHRCPSNRSPTFSIGMMIAYTVTRIQPACIPSSHRRPIRESMVSSHSDRLVGMPKITKSVLDANKFETSPGINIA
mmetsp:Transcript_23714/g.68203  ORF Transcript_23714/g.68203 Transcript_23714/m.68203 type:complete len:263 (-) Transcript_23714:263-1051(-)